MIKSNLITIKNLFDQAKIPAIIEEPASKQPKGEVDPIVKTIWVNF